MKYLKQELYEKACTVYESEYDDEWDKKYQESFNEFKAISSRFPKLFLKEFDKYHFHDNSLISASIRRVGLKRGYRHVLTMELSDYHDKKVIHSMTFTNVENFRSSLKLNASGEDWIYCEILPVDEKRTSLEVAFDDSMLYFEFSKMHYKKVRLQGSNDQIFNVEKA